MPSGIRISSEPAASDADAQRVKDGLSLYNVARTGQDYWRYVRLFVRDDKGLIRGGWLMSRTSGSRNRCVAVGSDGT